MCRGSHAGACDVTVGAPVRASQQEGRRIEELAEWPHALWPDGDDMPWIGRNGDMFASGSNLQK